MAECQTVGTLSQSREECKLQQQNTVPNEHKKRTITSMVLLLFRWADLNNGQQISAVIKDSAGSA